MSKERIKRQKTTNDSDEFNLNSKTIPQLLLIAEENGASFKKSTKKKELVEKISFLLQSKKDTLLKQDIDKNINSFNKQVVEFTIKDGIDPLEWSFWKVFRNKIIFRNIMSNTSHLSASYDSIKCVSSIIQRKQFSILRDKVIRNQYLTFSKIDEDPIIKIFKSFKSNDGDGDIIFYQQLFKNYSKYIQELNYHKTQEGTLIMDGSKNDRDKLVNKIIGAKCLPALKVLIQDYEYQPTLSNLKIAINNGALKFIDIFLQSKFKLSIDIKEYFSQYGGNYSLINVLKSLNYLHCNKIINITNVNPYASTNRTFLKLLVSKTIQNLNSGYTKLKSLLIIGKLILETIKNNAFSNDTTINETVSNINITIEEIESFSNNLTKVQLNSILEHKCNQHEPNREIIRKLLELYHLFTTPGLKKPLFYSSHFSNEVEIFTGGIKKSLENSFQFAKFVNLRPSSENESIILEYFSNCSIPHPDFIFSHCNDKDKQLQFVNSFIENCFPTSSIIKPFLFFYLIINYDDLELIKHVSSKLPIGKDEEDIGFAPYIITRFIKSIKTLDWLYENHKNHFKLDSWWYFKDLNLLKHYQSYNHNKGSHLKVPSFSENLLDFSLNYSNDLIQYIIDCGPSIFKIKYPFDIYWFIFNCPDNQYNVLNTSEIYKSVYLTFFQPNVYVQQNEMKSNERILYLQEKTSILPVMYEKSFEFTKFTDWLYVNFNNELKDSGIFGFGRNDYYLSLFIERYSNITDISKFDSSKLYIVENIRLLEYVLKLIFASNNENITQSKKASILSSILSGCIDGGNLKSIQYIHLNYPYALKKKLPKNDGILPLSDLKNIVIKSLKFDHIELLEYIFNLIPFNRNDFINNNVDPGLSRLYFLNRFK